MVAIERAPRSMGKGIRRSQEATEAEPVERMWTRAEREVPRVPSISRASHREPICQLLARPAHGSSGKTRRNSTRGGAQFLSFAIMSRAPRSSVWIEMSATQWSCSCFDSNTA